ncbi:uncharacterized protein LOC108893837 isoform X2 [Lates calcarifer]|uniref:Uncharacterized protein LOC108893837 isoform X2 n=1 Tax=Lates calcarifer TaxID=8187 RepID=A0AAJ8BL06_LATCA|nr:uncharacterized protein LOC108893837 isoform X2 [Lates calcarifer]
MNFQLRGELKIDPTLPNPPRARHILDGSPGNCLTFPALRASHCLCSSRVMRRKRKKKGGGGEGGIEVKWRRRFPTGAEPSRVKLSLSPPMPPPHLLISMQRLLLR